MKSTEIKFTAIPSTEEVKAERDRLAYRSRYGRVLRSTIYALVVVAAVAVLLATLFLPVLQVSGDSMNPTLEDKDILLLVKSDSMKTGDLCGFYWQNKLLLKRVIGQSGDVISMDEDGHVTVNGTVLPSTGGMGTTLFYVIGGGLMVAAVVLLVTKKRMEHKN